MTEYPTISVRGVEVILAVHFAILGVLFLLYPLALSGAVYAAWQERGSGFWSACALGVGVSHGIALWLNGSAPRWSTPVRIAACVLHLWLALSFAQMFISGGAICGAITYLSVVVPLLGLVCVPVVRHWSGLRHDPH